MWRKGVFLQFLLASLLLAGATEARQAGSSGSQDLGRRGRDHVASTSTRIGWDQRRIRLGDYRALVQEGDVGSHIDPDGVRAHARIDPNG